MDAMTDAQVNPTPKSRFQAEDANIKAHHALLENPAFQKAEDMTLLSYQRSLAHDTGTNTNPQVAAMVNGWKLAGVQEFLAEFHNLAEKKIETPPAVKTRMVDHKN
jgi:hypothetical protein